jgi:xylulose-5-phosphate/fructose-6-phosphate phosphoketolase
MRFSEPLVLNGMVMIDLDTAQPQPDARPATLPPPTAEEVESMDAWWRANNYLTIGQIYLQDNALLTEPLRNGHIKPRLLGHWGTSPGLSFIYTHVSRLIRHTSQHCIYMAGPGHGGPALVAAGWLEGTYSEIYPSVTQDGAGVRRLFRQFSAPGGIPSHVSVPTPGSIQRAASSATYWCTPLARCWTIRTC